MIKLSINTVSKLALAIFILLQFSCKKEDKNTQPITQKYMQYGVPFNNIPEISDIIMYEINLRAFSPTGDIQGVISKLDYIKSLGVNVIWLMPIHPIGEIKSINSPYSVKDYKAVGEEFGSLADLRRLTDSAHSRGIAVLMDWVANHSAWDNPWIENKDWYTQDGNGNIIHPAGTNWTDVADLNYSNTEMRSAMIDAMEYWLYEANIDGFRCDHADGVPFDFWKAAWEKFRAIPGRKFIFLAEGSRSDHFTADFDLNFSWKFYNAIKDVFKGQDVVKVFSSHAAEYNNVPAGKHWLRFTTNHDESAWDATPIALFDGAEGALAASVVTIFTGGVPLIYGSQEVGIAQTIPFFSKTNLNWNNNPAMLTTYRQILNFYSSSEPAKKGQLTAYAHQDIACFSKTYNNQNLLIVANLRNRLIQFSIPGALNNTTWKNALNQDSLNLEDSLSLNPYEFMILEDL